MKKIVFILAAALTIIVIVLFACVDYYDPPEEINQADVVINFDAKKTGHEIADTMWGIFYEDINFGADGGLYPELVRNRSFEYRTAAYNPSYASHHTNSWIFAGSGSVSGQTTGGLNAANTRYIRVNITGSGYTMTNRGYGPGSGPAMAIAAGKIYNFFLYAKNPGYTGEIVCEVVNGSGGSMTVSPFTVSSAAITDSWVKFSGTFSANASGSGQLRLTFNGTGTVDLDFISLMSADTHGYGLSTWPYGGLRKDLTEALRDLNPGFIRFPGGCIVEGAYRHDTHYNWKDTIGLPEERKENYNLWNYMMSYGLGFHEFFQLCEDLGAEPVPVLYAGLVCQARRPAGQFEADLLPGDPKMEQLIQDYLDLIEYANGSVGTQWGAKRAANGHPEPFNLKKIGIGNENWNDSAANADYFRNYEHIRNRIKAVYPGMDFITSTGPYASGWINDLAWPIIREKFTADIVDEHYYNDPAWFLNNTRRYDHPSLFPRDGTRIFVGEYAAHEAGSSTSRPNTWNAALCEAAYMTGIERNADIVVMASYAPLFAREGMVQWTPDMIWFDAEKITNLTPSYHVQRIFANNTGKYTLRLDFEPGPITGIFQTTSIDGNKVYSKVVNPRDTDRTVYLKFSNLKISSARLTRLSGAPSAVTVTIGEDAVKTVSGGVIFNVPAYSMALVRIND